ncbi:MAG: alpha/beta fold hydrolase BchO [Paracoccaceae bacterium]
MTPADWETTGRGWPNRDASQFLRAGLTDWHVQRMGQNEGKAPVMLLLHGAGAATHSWRDLMPMLARTHDVIAPDLPGHGFSRAPAGTTSTLPGMANEITALLAAMDAHPNIIVGHSAGTAIALEMVLSEPTRPDKTTPHTIIGLNAALAPFRGLAGVLFPPMAKMLALNPLAPWAFSHMAGWSGQARRLIEGTGSRITPEGLGFYARMLATPRHVSGALAMMAHWDLEPMLDRLSKLAVPLELIVGSGDKAVPPDEAARLAARYSQITLHKNEGLGHLMHEEEPERFASMITALAAEASTIHPGS